MNGNLFNDPEVPLWMKLIHLPEESFERSQYAGESIDGKGKFRLKDLGVMRQLAPGLYEAAAEDMKAHNDMIVAHGNAAKKYKLGKKIGSIPLIDTALHPELATDKKAQERYWKQHPELKAL